MMPISNVSADVIEQVLKEGQPTVNVRYCYEGVDDSVHEDAGGIRTITAITHVYQGRKLQLGDA